MVKTIILFNVLSVSEVAEGDLGEDVCPNQIYVVRRSAHIIFRNVTVLPILHADSLRDPLRFR